MENTFILIYFTSFVYFLSKSAKTFSDKDIHILHKLLTYNFMFACILSEDLLQPTEVKFFTFPVLHSEKMGHLQQ